MQALALMSRPSLSLSATAPPSLSSATERPLAKVITPQVPRDSSGSSVAPPSSSEKLTSKEEPTSKENRTSKGKPTSKEDLIAQARQLTADSSHAYIKTIAESLRSIDNKVLPPAWATSSMSTRKRAMLQSLHDWYGDVLPSADLQSRGSPPPLSTGLSVRLADMTTGRKRDSPTVAAMLDLQPPVTRQRSSEPGEPGVVRQRSIDARAAEIKKRSLSSRIFSSLSSRDSRGRRDSCE